VLCLFPIKASQSVQKAPQTKRPSTTVNPTLVTFWDEAQSLREAYIGAGIIKAPKLTKTTVPESLVNGRTKVEPSEPKTKVNQ
jgi:hypothetical protein